MTDLEFWASFALAIPGLFLPVATAGWKGRAIIPIALLSLVFWPGALILVLRVGAGVDCAPMPTLSGLTRIVLGVVDQLLNLAEQQMCCVVHGLILYPELT